MKRMQWLLAVMAAATLGLAGCSKKEEPPMESVQVNGVSVDMPKLRDAFSSSTNQDLRKILFDVDQHFRFGDYLKCMMSLDELSNQPDVTESQKKMVADVIEQVKKLAANAPAPAQ